MEKTLSKAKITRLSEKGIEVTEYIGSGASSDVFAIAPYKGNERLCMKYFYDIIVKESPEEKTPHKGYSVMLTINDELQQFAYSLTEGEQASIVVLNRHSGEILALTSTYQQDFDLGSTLTDEMLAAYNNSGEPVWTPDVGLAMLTQGVIDNELFRPHVTKAVQQA